VTPSLKPPSEKVEVNIYASLLDILNSFVPSGDRYILMIISILPTSTMSSLSSKWVSALRKDTGHLNLSMNQLRFIDDGGIGCL